MKDITHKMKIVAGAPNYQDVIDLMEALKNEAADIRNPLIKSGASIEAREGAVAILTHAVDRLKGLGNNRRQRLGDLDENS